MCVHATHDDASIASFVLALTRELFMDTVELCYGIAEAHAIVVPLCVGFPRPVKEYHLASRSRSFV